MSDILNSGFANFHIRSVCGTGGMGTVYEAWDPRLERRVAIKVLHEWLTQAPAHRGRLLREARLAARVEHPGVVRIYNVHEVGGVLGIEMEFLEGVSFLDLQHGRPFHPAQIAKVMEHVLEALSACHRRGVVHGDLKPSNLMVAPDGRVLLADFGIAQALFSSDARQPSSLATSAQLWSTPQYTPPEAWESATPSPAWDLYALGVLSYEALAGGLPFKATNPAVLMREKLDGDPQPMGKARTDLSPAFGRLVDCLQARTADQRPPSASAALELLRATKEWQQGDVQTLPLSPQAGSPSQRISSPFRIGSALASLTALRHPLSRTLVLSVGAALLGLLAGTLLTGGNNRVAEMQQVLEPLGKPGEILDLCAHEDAAYFSYDDGVHGREIWRATPDGRVELAMDINPGPGSSNPRNFRPQGRNVFLSAETVEFGEEPWVIEFDKTFQNIHMIRDIVPGSASSSPIGFGGWNDVQLFWAFTYQYGLEPWLSNGNEKATGLLRDLDNRSGDSHAVRPMASVDEEGAYFVAHNNTARYRLWRYDHNDGTLLDLCRAEKSISEMCSLGDNLFLSMEDGEHGRELWIYRRGMKQLELLMDINPGAPSSNPSNFFAWNGQMYMQASSEEFGAELWVSDGAREHTRQVADIYPYRDSSAPFGFCASPEWLFFRADDPAFGRELWCVNATATECRMAADVYPGPQSSDPYSLAWIGDRLFFSADDGVHGEELWQFIPSQTRTLELVADIQIGPEGSEPHGLTATGTNSGVFILNTPHGQQLMRVEITHAGATLVGYADLSKLADGAQ